MWLTYTIIHCFTMALVNYIDEYLTHNNKVTTDASTHTQIGGLILISTLLSIVTISSLFLYLDDVSIDRGALYLALASAVPMVIVWTSYFYLFLKYPAHQVVPLFGLASLWLLLIEVFFGAVVSITALLGIAILIYGAYLLDSGTIKWQIPTKLLLLMLPVSLMWATVLFLVRTAAETADVLTIYFYQYLGIGIIGILLTLLVVPYRRGLVYRVKLQGKNFLGFSLANETISQISFLFIMLAVAIAPLGAYVTALGGIQSIFVLLLFFFFPLHERSKVTTIQWSAMALIILGVFVIEIWK